MSNPIMSKNPYFQKGATTPNTSYLGGGNVATDSRVGSSYQQGAPYSGYQNTQPGMGYDSPYAQSNAYPVASESSMTYDDAMVKTAILLAVSIIAGSITMVFVPMQTALAVMLPASIGAFIVGMIGAFKQSVGPGISITYSALQGVALGAITKFFDNFYPGVAFQAILGTTIVVGVTVFLHMSGRVRTTPRGRKIAMSILFAYVIFGIINLIISAFGGPNLRGFGGNLTLGLILGLGIILVAAYILIMDLETAQLAVENRAPKSFSWTVGFGIVMTVLWIYIEVLRVVVLIANAMRD